MSDILYTSRIILIQGTTLKTTKQKISSNWGLVLRTLFCTLLIANNAMQMHGQTLAEAFADLLEYNPQIHSAETNALSSESAIGSEKSSRRPSVRLSLSSGYERYEDSISDDFSDGPSNTATLSADQLIYDGGESRNRVLAAKQQYVSSKLQLYEVNETSAFQLTTTYLDVIRYRQLILLSEANIETYQIALDKIREKFESGATPEADVLLLEARKSNAEATLESRHLQLKSAETQFQNLTGKAPGTFSQPDFPTEKILTNLNIEDFADNPSIQVAKSNESLAEIQRNQLKGKFRPSISLSLQSTYRDSSRASSVGEENSAFISLSYDIFDSGRRRNDTQKANYEIQRASYDRYNIELDTYREYQDALNSLKISEGRIAQLSKYKANIEKVVSAYKEQFNLGQRALINVLDVENELFNASSSLAEEEIVRLQSAYRVMRTIGSLKTHLAQNFESKSIK
ncbi:TolC family protein [Puniceicoccaceae bacterium K14]|nr:TolC family protein [Puniceicoccaceae bacterium K14]